LIKSLTNRTEGGNVAIDGEIHVILMIKKSPEQGAIHMVSVKYCRISAWASWKWIKNQAILAIPELLKVIELSGCIVTIDVIGYKRLLLINERC